MVIKFLRKKKNMKIVLWIVAILIIPGFIIWGVGIGGGGKSQYYAAVINKEPITYTEYYNNLSDIEKKYREIFGEKSSEFLKNLNIEQGVLEDIIRERIILQQAKRKRIRVSNNEIVEMIKSDPVFLDEKGRFDEKKFKEIISYYPTEELREIEDEIRKRIRIEKLKELVISEGNIIITDEEVDKYLQTQQVTDQDKDSVRRTLLWQKREQYFNQWYAETRKNAKVTINIPLEKEFSPELPDENSEAGE